MLLHVAWEHHPPSTQQEQFTLWSTILPPGRESRGHTSRSRIAKSICVGGGPEWTCSGVMAPPGLYILHMWTPVQILVFSLLGCNYEEIRRKSVKAETDKPEELKSDFVSLNWLFLHAANGSHGFVACCWLWGFYDLPFRVVSIFFYDFNRSRVKSCMLSPAFL